MTTTIFQQYKELKKKHPDALLLFRCGDFYETYCEDAENAAKTLGITLTKTNDLKMAGFPYHALDTYLPKLIRAGYRVAICDQLDTPKTALVKRGVTEMVTPAGKPTAKKNHTISLPRITKQQYDLLCECIRYRAADNQKECADARSKGHFTQWYDAMATELNELKDIIYNLK